MSAHCGTFCLWYPDCRSSGQDVPLVLRGKRSSHVAFLPSFSQAALQLTEAWRDFGGQVRGRGITQGPWSLKVEVVPKHVPSWQTLARTPQHVRHIGTILANPNNCRGWVPAPRGGTTHTKQQKLQRTRDFSKCWRFKLLCFFPGSI